MPFPAKFTGRCSKCQSVFALGDIVSAVGRGRPGYDAGSRKYLCSNCMPKKEPKRRSSSAESKSGILRIEIVRGDKIGRAQLDTYHYKLPLMLRMVAGLRGRDRNIWLSGPAGSGKTTAAEQLADTLGVDYAFMGAINSPYQLTGFIDAGGTYHASAFRRIYENGGVILLDECDASSPAALLELNAALAGKDASFPDQMVRRHRDCYVVAAANTWGFGGDSNYVGRAKLDAAFLDRFVTIDWDYDETLERKLAGNDVWTAIVQNTRRLVRSNGAQVVISPRASIKGAQLLEAGMSNKEVVEAVFGRYRSHNSWPVIGREAENFALRN